MIPTPSVEPTRARCALQPGHSDGLAGLPHSPHDVLSDAYCFHAEVFGGKYRRHRTAHIDKPVPQAFGQRPAISLAS